MAPLTLAAVVTATSFMRLPPARLVALRRRAAMPHIATQGLHTPPVALRMALRDDAAADDDGGDASSVDEVVGLLGALVAEHDRAPLSACDVHARLQSLTLVTATMLPPLDADAIGRMKAAELREQLSALGLSTRGLKGELAQRLADARGDLPDGSAEPPPPTPTTPTPTPTRDAPAAHAPSLQAKLDAVVSSRRGPQSGIFCDGSTNPNPGPGGWGVVAVRDGAILWSERGDAPHTTNNRMELSAIIAALRRLPEGDAAATTIYSDSRLCVQTLAEWAPRWERNGWTRRDGEPIKNLELVREAVELARSRPGVAFEWQKGHAGSTWNEYADRLAGWRPDRRG